MKFAAAAVLLLALASVASARPVGLRNLLDAKKEPIYCTGADHAKDECPEHYECAALDKKVCKQVQDCKTDRYGKQTCTYKQQCWEYECVEVPKYCEVAYVGEDECMTKYGKDLKCEKLKKKECVYEKECEYVDTDKCKEYEYERKCIEVPTKICLKYNQVQKCEKDRQVCKEYKQERKCEQGKCTKYDAYGACTAYGQADCKYVDTDKCKVYETVKGKCVYVNGACKEYKKEQKCDNVKKGCKVYEQEEVCKDVEVCWTGKCVEVPKKFGYSAGK
ncbi:unnamed protein product [Ostreobium quekettii]|uniref:Uncharacterized protein n=1 Tax=Ostreobium quekettii TaxID=121088 RepID=A0A8S1J359_9CHLO|nr:unnamed protein product [Ostreobium quekettii]|eukprot:evm.model.scf_1292.4 EVM.evm.TU.scf_1292.4   scf_1292:39982-41816(-)